MKPKTKKMTVSDKMTVIKANAIAKGIGRCLKLGDGLFPITDKNKNIMFFDKNDLEEEQQDYIVDYIDSKIIQPIGSIVVKEQKLYISEEYKDLADEKGIIILSNNYGLDAIWGEIKL